MKSTNQKQLSIIDQSEVNNENLDSICYFHQWEPTLVISTVPTLLNSSSQHRISPWHKFSGMFHVASNLGNFSITITSSLFSTPRPELFLRSWNKETVSKIQDHWRSDPWLLPWHCWREEVQCWTSAFPLFHDLLAPCLGTLPWYCTLLQQCSVDL